MKARKGQGGIVGGAYPATRRNIIAQKPPPHHHHHLQQQELHLIQIHRIHSIQQIIHQTDVHQ